MPDPPAPAPRPGATNASAHARPPSARFDMAMFEEGQRGGNPWLTALDTPGTRPAPARDLPLERDRWLPNRPDDVPDSELGLADLLDIINPLQHIPVIGNVYRVLTGDTISGPAQVAGAALYGGPIGLINGIVKAVATEINGAVPGDTLVARLIGTDTLEETAVAQAAPEAAAVPDDGEPVAAAPPLAHTVATDPSTPPVLTGDTALAALFGDLRTQDGDIELGVAAPSPAVETLDGQAERQDDDRALGAAVPEHAFSARMMEGLDKYRALAVERGGAGRPDPARLDRNL